MIFKLDRLSVSFIYCGLPFYFHRYFYFFNLSPNYSLFWLGENSNVFRSFCGSWRCQFFRFAMTMKAFFYLLLPVATVAQLTATIQVCGWFLNRLLQLKSFLKEGEAECYKGVTVQYVQVRINVAWIIVFLLSLLFDFSRIDSSRAPKARWRSLKMTHWWNKLKWCG